MTARRSPRPIVVALSLAFALSVLAGTGLGFALTSPPLLSAISLGL